MIMMRLEISEERFRSTCGFELGWELIQGPIQLVRGRSLAVKKEVFDQLTAGQKALFSFWVMYGHVQSGWLAFFQSRYGEYIPMMRKALIDIDDRELLADLDQAASLFQGYEGASSPASPSTEQIVQQFEPLDERLNVLLPATMQRLENLIREKPEEFVVFST
jgi:hypothetical protein